MLAVISASLGCAPILEQRPSELPSAPAAAPAPPPVAPIYTDPGDSEEARLARSRASAELACSAQSVKMTRILVQPNRSARAWETYRVEACNRVVIYTCMTLDFTLVHSTAGTWKHVSTGGCVREPG